MPLFFWSSNLKNLKDTILYTGEKNLKRILKIETKM